MASQQGQCAETLREDSGNSPAWRRLGALVAIALSVMLGARVDAAFTEPRLALVRVTAYRSTSGASTLTLAGSFSYADAVQLALPLNVIVTQGQLSARFDLAGNVFTSTGGGLEQPAAGPGVVSFAPREIVLALPPGFSAGTAMVQVVADFDSQRISSNQLSFTL